jgi:hypothetical protein
MASSTTIQPDPNRLVRTYPCPGSLKIPAHFVGTDREMIAEYQAVRVDLEQRANSLGFRKVKITRSSVTRLVGPIHQRVIDSDELVPDPSPGSSTAWLSSARAKAARVFRTQVIRSLHSERSKFRNASLFAAGRRPSSFIWWERGFGEQSEPTLEAIVAQCRLAAAFDLEHHLSLRFFYADHHSIAFEICQPGASILEGWKCGDLSFLSVTDDNDPGPDADHGLAAA